MGRPRKIEIPMDEVRQLTGDEWSLKRLAARYGCSRQTILNRMGEAGIAALPQHSCPGDRNPAWKGGERSDGKGYLLVHSPDHPNADKHRCVRKHRLVAESILGRYLTKEEVVDHIDGDTMNNHPDNLRVFARNAEHLAVTLKGRVPNWTPEGLARIREGGRLRKGRIPPSIQTE